MSRHGFFWFHQWAAALAFANVRAKVSGRKHTVRYGRTSLMWVVGEA